MAQTTKVVCWKIYNLRKRRWLITLFEIIVPIAIFYLMAYVKTLAPSGDGKVLYDDNPSNYNEVMNYGDYRVAYTPPNSFTDAIMASVLKKLQDSSGLVQVKMVPQPNEEGVVNWLKQQYINDTSDTSFTGPDTSGVGVVFFNTDDPTNLKYTLRTSTSNIATSQDSIYGEQRGFTLLYEYSGFSTIQAAIDQAYLLNVHKVNTSSMNILTENLPLTLTGSVDLITLLLPFLITIGFLPVLPALLRGIIEEKTSGIKEMTLIMGLKNWINWMSWIVYGMVVYIPVTLVVALILSSGEQPSIKANVFVLWGLLVLFILAFVAFTCAVSTLFTNGTIATIVGVIAWFSVSQVLNSMFVSNPEKYSFTINILSCLWPSVSLSWALNVFLNYEKNGDTWTPSHLFNDGAGGGRLSVGWSVIMFCVDIVVYSVITWYIDSVKPGPYGRAKSPLFIFQCFKKKEYSSESKSEKDLQNNYERPPSNASVGLKIANLRKTFNGGKVAAVRGLDLDIYKGNITALLGHNGAGKTTTMSIISGFFSPTSGKVIVDGKNIFDNMDEFRSSLGLCPQHDLLFSFFTVLEHLIFFGMLKGLSMSQSKTEGVELLRTLKMEEKKNEMVSKLSGGMKRRLCLCVSLIGNPKVLILDEPTSGLDPESRRQVWDVLLGFRGQRTTIITTHFMEEADVLGDRIAIMDHGKVICYGTSMFLKKLYGTGYYLNISKLERAQLPSITRVVEQYVTSAAVKQTSPSQLEYNIKSDESSRFPALFSALENVKEELGITGMSLDCTTMEDVFLKVAESADKKVTETDVNMDSENIFKQIKKTKGVGLVVLQLRALVYKRYLTTIRKWKSTLLFIILPVLLMAYAVKRSMEFDYSPNQPDLPITVSSFPNIHIPLASDNSSVTALIKQFADLGKAVLESIPADTVLDSYMGQKISQSLIEYERQMIAGFQYNSTVFLGGYSNYFVHSVPLVLNMIANTLLQLASPSSSISLSSHPITVKSSQDICDLSGLAPSHVFLFPQINTFSSFAVIILLMNFISFPLKERVTRAKQLQLMTGVSPLLYWMTNLFFDMIIYIITAVLMFATVYLFEVDSIYSSSGYMGTLALVLFLFGFSGIMYAYFFSFLLKSAVKSAVIFLIINAITGLVGSVILSFLGQVYSTYDLAIFVLSFNPIFAVTSCLIHLLSAMYINGTCIQCGKGCSTTDPMQFLETGPQSKQPHGIYNFVIFLVADALIYFCLVMIIEYGLVKKLWFFVSKMWIKFNPQGMEEDTDVLSEKERVMSSQSLKGLVSNVSVLKVKDLRKKYNKKTTAVHGVTFQVGRGECFGLLGVNGAGKTTTFKMLTGEEIPNKGDASILQCSLRNQKSKFLGSIGYCPQFDAINKLLTGREMLHVYAQLRGIPPAHCDSEVSRWVQIMGLKEYGDRPCGTYSGGNKRKLSTAMAFIGDPPVVFLDEPTSGVDPVSRRKLWDVVSKCQLAGQSIVLTSHSMEECEALCSRLTIMVSGQMKCIGTTQYLKHKFGQGYTIKIKLSSSNQSVDALKQNMAALFRNCSVKDEHLGLLHYHVPDPSIRLSELFHKMESLKRKYESIEDYVVSDTTLEEVFMSFARIAAKVEV